MRILLRARARLLNSRPAETNRTNSSSFRSAINVDDPTEISNFYSIFAPKNIQNLQLTQIFRRNIGTTSVKSKQVQNVANGTDVADDYIYNGKSTSTVKRLRLYSFVMSIGGLYTQPFLWENSQLFADTGLTIQDSFCLPGAIGIILPILIHYKIKSYVVDMRYNKETDEYTCSTMSLFLLKDKIKFKVEDIQQTENTTSGILLKIGPKNVPLLFEAASFIKSEHYERILGYDTRTKETITDGETIYSSPHTKSISRSKIFCHIIFFSGIMAQQTLMHMWGVWGCSIIDAFIILIPILTHLRVKNIVLDMRYNKESDEYTCNTNSLFSLGNKIRFKVEDIQNLDAQTIFTSFRVGPKKVPLFIEKGNFTDPSHYKRLMGYDKSFDFGTNVDLLDEVKRKSIEAGNHQKTDASRSTDNQLKKKEQRA